MNKKKIRIILCVLLAAAGLTAAGAMAAGGAGSQSDPLVTLSYLTETFTGQMMEKVDALIVQRNAQLALEPGESPALPGESAAYAAVTLAAGQTLFGDAGCEVLLRSGAAACAASSSPGLVDATAGSSLDGGAALQTNHLYLMTDSRAVTTASGATLLVRGSYLIG